MNAADAWAGSSLDRRFMSQSMASAPVGVVLLDHEGRFRYVNPYFLALAGREAGYFLGRSLRELDDPLFPPATQQLIAARVDRRVQTGESIVDEEVEMLGADGVPIPICYSASGIRDTDGNVVGEVAFVADNRVRQAADLARDRALQCVRDLEELQRSMIDNADIWLNVLDRDFNVLQWNSTAERLSGHAPRDVRGHARVWEWLYPEPGYREELMERVRYRVLQHGEILQNHETTIQTRDGHERVMSWTVRNLIYPDGRTRGLLVVGQDLTEKRRMEASLANSDRLASMGVLAGGVAHEINNPISIVLNCVELALDEVTADGGIRDNLVDIREAGQRIATTVRNLLSFARSDTEETGPADLANLVERTVSLVQRLLERDHIRIEIDSAAGLPLVHCQPDRIEQVLMNLLTNARDALDARYRGAHRDKAVAITTGVHVDADGHWVRTTVEDRGEGIPPQMLDRIFDPFVTSKPRDRGTGLGLSVSHGIVADHEGRLIVESEQGHFTRFHLDLPAIGPLGAESDVFLPERDSVF